MLKMTINYGGRELKNVKMFRGQGKTTKHTDLSYGYIEDHIYSRKMKTSSNILIIVYYKLTSGCYTSHIFDLHLQSCVICLNMRRVFPFDCIPEDSVFKLKLFLQAGEPMLSGNTSLAHGIQCYPSLLLLLLIQRLYGVNNMFIYMHLTAQRLLTNCSFYQIIQQEKYFYTNPGQCEVLTSYL